jgi:hypothetical protein
MKGILRLLGPVAALVLIALSLYGLVMIVTGGQLCGVLKCMLPVVVVLVASILMGS